MHAKVGGQESYGSEMQLRMIGVLQRHNIVAISTVLCIRWVIEVNSSEVHIARFLTRPSMTCSS